MNTLKEIQAIAARYAAEVRDINPASPPLSPETTIAILKAQILDLHEQLSSLK